MHQPTKASLLWTCSLAIATGTLLGCGVFDTQTASPEVELMSILKTDSGGDVLAGLEASYCGGTRCAIAVPVGWSGEPDKMGIGPLGGEPLVGTPCPNSTSGPIGFSAVTCLNPANEVGLALCLQTTGNNESAIWGPCAATAVELGREHYLEAFMMLATPLRRALALKPTLTVPATQTGSSGSWPAGPAKVCVAVAPNRGVVRSFFLVDTQGSGPAVRIERAGGAPSSPLCVDVQIPDATTSVRVRTTGDASGVGSGVEKSGKIGPHSCEHTFTSPDDSNSKPVCSGAFATTNGAVVGVAADTAARFDKVYAELLAWLSNKSR